MTYHLGTSLRRSTHHSGGGRRGGFGVNGPFSAKEGSARATEGSVRTVRVREGAGGDRSRVREVVGGRGTERSGAKERPERP